MKARIRRRQPAGEYFDVVLQLDTWAWARNDFRRAECGLVRHRRRSAGKGRRRQERHQLAVKLAAKRARIATISASTAAGNSGTVCVSMMLRRSSSMRA